MGIRFYCPNGHKLNVKEFQAGRRGICPYCGAKIQIPLQSTRPSTREEMQAAAAMGEAALAGQGPSGIPLPGAPMAVPGVPGAPGGMSPANDPALLATPGYQAAPAWPASGTPATAPTLPGAASPAAGGYASAPMGPMGGSLYSGGATHADAAAHASLNPSAVAASPAPIYPSSVATDPAAIAGVGTTPIGAAGSPAIDPYAPYAAAGLNPMGAGPVAGTAAPMAAVGGAAAPAGAAAGGLASAGMSPAATLPAQAVTDPLIEAGAAVWYVRPAAGGQYGPAGPDAMRQWLAENRIAGDSLVWREGWRDWRTAAEVFPQLNPAAQLSPFAALGVETSRGAAGSGAKVVLPRRSNSTLQLALVIVLAVAVIVLGIVFYVVLTKDSGQPGPSDSSKPPATAPSGTNRPPAAAPGGGARPPAATPAGPTTPGRSAPPSGPSAPAPPAVPPTPPATDGSAPAPPAAPSGG